MIAKCGHLGRVISVMFVIFVVVIFRSYMHPRVSGNPTAFHVSATLDTDLALPAPFLFDGTTGSVLCTEWSIFIFIFMIIFIFIFMIYD